MLPTESTHAANLARFARLTARPESDIDLALGALLIAADGRPDLRFEPTLDALERLAERVRVRLDRAPVNRARGDPGPGPAQPPDGASRRARLAGGARRGGPARRRRATQSRSRPGPGRPPRTNGPLQRGDLPPEPVPGRTAG